MRRKLTTSLKGLIPREGGREREREKDVESKKLCTKREERETEDRKDMKERSGAARCRLASHC